MNHLRHLICFFEKASDDTQLNPTHISLYVSLFQFWNFNQFKNPISISRSEVMSISKIASKTTYHKCMKDLHSGNYITYEPSYNPFKSSQVFIHSFLDDSDTVSSTNDVKGNSAREFSS